jgi:hypothetical protein
VYAGDGVVGVDQEHRSVWEIGGERAERGLLVRERFDVGVGHRARRAQPVPASGLDVAGGREPGDRGRAGHAHGGVHSVSAPEREVDQFRAAAGEVAARGLARHRRLEGDQVEQRGLHQLCLGDRGSDLEQRLVGEDDPALGNGPHVAREPDRAQVGHPGSGEGEHATAQASSPAWSRR